MARKILNRKDLRNAYDEAERRKEEDEEGDESEEEEQDEEKEEGEEEEEDGQEEEEEEAEEEVPPKRKSAAKPKPQPKPQPKPKPKTRSRAAKIVRLRVVWGVFNNSHQMVASYEYAKKSEAHNHAARLTTEKRSTHFVQPVKEPMEEKKEKGS